MNIPCAVEQDLLKHLDNEDRLQALADKADRIAAELMQPGAEFWPYSFENFDAALFELGQNGSDLAKVEAALARFAHGECKPLQDLVHDYYAAKANAKAEVMADKQDDDFDVPDRYDD